MGTRTGIAWTDHTFNPWRGCEKVSPGCAHCYADTLSKRNPGTLGVWGGVGAGTRVVAADSYWRLPLRWNAEAMAAGTPRRVFCASLADVFEDWRGPVRDTRGVELYVPGGPVDSGGVLAAVARAWAGRATVAFPSPQRPAVLDDLRRRLFDLIAATPWLDWLLLTKRPENAARMIAAAGGIRGHVWLGTTAENQDQADRRLPELLKVEGVDVRFVSLEPLLERVELRVPFSRFAAPGCTMHGAAGLYVDALRGAAGDPPIPRVDWLIVGGESGPGARPLDVAWARDVRDQGRRAGVAVFVKQMGAHPFDGEEPDHNPSGADEPRPMRLRDRAGADPSEWPADLRVQEFPATARRAVE